MNKEQKKNIIVIRTKRKSNEGQKKKIQYFDRYSTGGTKEKGKEYEG